MFRILRRPNFWVVLLGDAVLVSAAYFLAYYLRFDGDIPAGALAKWRQTLVWIVPLKLRKGLGAVHSKGSVRGSVGPAAGQIEHETDWGISDR
jgi:hypothetical protein